MNNSEKQMILLIEDNPGDARLIREMLNEITSFQYNLTIAETLREGCTNIRAGEFILILLDLNLPDSSGKDTFDTVMHLAGDTPVVLVSGLLNVELSISLIQDGAQDYIVKPDLTSTLLSRTIKFAIERKKLLTDLKVKSTELEQLNSFFVNREIRMVELKHEINKLLVMAGKEKRYTV